MLKLIKILRITRMAKDFRKITMYMDKYLFIKKVGWQRLIFLTMMFVISSHVVTCFWIIFSFFVSDDNEGTWSKDDT